MTQRARIKLASTDIGKINQICTDIKDIAEKTGVELRGPIPLPTKTLKVTTRKSPCGDGKATWERYEMRIHKRLIDLSADERTLRLVMRVPIPEGLNIEIEMVGQIEPTSKGSKIAIFAVPEGLNIEIEMVG